MDTMQSYQERAHTFLKKKNYDQAAIYFGLAKMYNESAKLYLKLAKGEDPLYYKKAAEMFKKANQLDYYKKSLLKAKELYEISGRTHEIAEILIELGDTLENLDFYLEAVDFLSLSKVSKHTLYTTQIKIANCYVTMDEFEKAIGYYETAFTMNDNMTLKKYVIQKDLPKLILCHYIVDGQQKSLEELEKWNDQIPHFGEYEILRNTVISENFSTYKSDPIIDVLKDKLHNHFLDSLK